MPGVSWASICVKSNAAGRRATGNRCRPWGAGVVEIRVRDAEGTFRLFYVAKFAEAVYVLHAFQKKSQKTSALDLELARSRYAAVRRHRQEK